MDAAPIVTPTPAGWMGADMASSPERWTRRWTESQLGELLRWAEVVRDLDLSQLTSDSIDSDVLHDLATDIREDLIHGRGFTLLRGLPVGDLRQRTAAVAFMVLGRLVGSFRSQNGSGHLLGHVRDVGGDLADPGTRIYQTNERQSFHTDSTDAVGLLCLRTARSGGLSQLASAETAYRIMRERRPDLARRLFDPIATDRRGEVPDGEDQWFEIPVLSWFEDRLTVIYQRTYIDSAGRLERAPRPDEQQVEALDLWDEIVNEPGVHLSMELEPGDIQFVYNHSLLHDRTSFVDYSDPDRRRHLLRLWLSLPDDRPLPPVFAQRYGSTRIGDRGGIVLADTQPCVPMDVIS